MKKQQKQRTSRPKAGSEEHVPLNAVEWQHLFKAFREAFDWALDIASSLARDFQEEVDAIERVRSFMHAQLTGTPASVSVDDVMLTFGLLISAIDRDLGPTNAFAPYHMPVVPMQFPSAADELPRVPRILIARPPWSRATSRHLAV